MTTKTTDNLACSCGGSFDRIDAWEHSVTVACERCRHASLVIDHPDFKLNVGLRDFHLKRGEGPDRRSLEDHAMATRLVECLVGRGRPSPATMVDFGIDTERHFGALEHAVRGLDRNAVNC